MAIMIQSELGEVIIESNVIATIAGAVVNKCYGVVGMVARSKKDGIANLLKGDKITRGIKVEAEDGGIVIEMHIMVEYGVNIHAICDSIIHNVRYRIEEKTGLKVNKVNVQVDSVRVQD